MKILIFIVLNFALEIETIYKPPTLDELVGIEIARFDVRNGKDGKFFVTKHVCTYISTNFYVRFITYTSKI